MKSDLRPGIAHRFTFRIPATKAVPHLYAESPEFLQAVNPHLDWPAEQTVGTHINVSHSAATPPGLDVTVKVELVQVEGRRLVFEVEAHDGVDLISRGSHERFVIDRARFGEKVQRKSPRFHP